MSKKRKRQNVDKDLKDEQTQKHEKFTYDPFRRLGPNAANPILELGLLLKQMAAQRKSPVPIRIESTSSVR